MIVQCNVTLPPPPRPRESNFLYSNKVSCLCGSRLPKAHAQFKYRINNTVSLGALHRRHSPVSSDELNSIFRYLTFSFLFFTWLLYFFFYKKYFAFSPRSSWILGWMVWFSEIQPFPDFLETFMRESTSLFWAEFQHPPKRFQLLPYLLELSIHMVDAGRYFHKYASAVNKIT